jgi:hypothetical protein
LLLAGRRRVVPEEGSRQRDYPPIIPPSIRGNRWPSGRQGLGEGSEEKQSGEVFASRSNSQVGLARRRLAPGPKPQPSLATTTPRRTAPSLYIYPKTRQFAAGLDTVAAFPPFPRTRPRPMVEPYNSNRADHQKTRIKQ